MTESRSDHEGSRLDLRLLDVGDEQARADEVMRAVMERIARGATEPDWLVGLVRARRALATVAAILLLIAGAFVMRESGTDTGIELAEQIESWALTRHAPTNGELLAAYKGYGQ